jgi:transposase
MIDGILRVLSDGGRWRNLPTRFGPWQSVYDRFRNWTRRGLWDRILDAPAGTQDAPGRDRLGIVRHRRHDHPSPSIGRWGAGKNRPVEEPQDHALGRSQGGFSNTVHLICDGKGTPLAVAVSPGQEHETQRFVPLMEDVLSWPERPVKLAGDKGYSAGWIREWLRERGIKPVIAHQKNEAARAGKFDRKSYRQRNIIERCVNSLKWFRRVATRYEKLVIHYLGMVKLAIIFRLL